MSIQLPLCAMCIQGGLFQCWPSRISYKFSQLGHPIHTVGFIPHRMRWMQSLPHVDSAIHIHLCQHLPFEQRNSVVLAEVFKAVSAFVFFHNLNFVSWHRSSWTPPHPSLLANLSHKFASLQKHKMENTRVFILFFSGWTVAAIISI